MLSAAQIQNSAFIAVMYTMTVHIGVNIWLHYCLLSQLSLSTTHLTCIILNHSPRISPLDQSLDIILIFKISVWIGTLFLWILLKIREFSELCFFLKQGPGSDRNKKYWSTSSRKLWSWPLFCSEIFHSFFLLLIEKHPNSRSQHSRLSQQNRSLFLQFILSEFFRVPT